MNFPFIIGTIVWFLLLISIVCGGKNPALVEYVALYAFSTVFIVILLEGFEKKLVQLQKQNFNKFCMIYIIFCIILGGLFITNYNPLSVCTFICYISLLIFGRIKYFLNKEKNDLNLAQNNEFESKYPAIVDKYKSAIKTLDEKGEKYISYRNIAENLFTKSKELYFSRERIIEDKKRITNTIKELEEVLNNTNGKADKKEIVKSRLDKAKKKDMLYETYIKDTQEAIESTMYDFVCIKADIELAASDSSSEVKVNTRALEDKSKSITYLLKNLPVVEDDNDM